MKDPLYINSGLHEHLFQSFLNNSPSPAWMADEEGHVLFMNTRALEIWNLDHTYLNRHASQLFPPDIAERFVASDKALLETGKQSSFISKVYRQDGYGGYYMFNKAVLPGDIQGKRIVASHAIDITDQVNHKKALDKSNERFGIITKVISDCIWDSDLETGEVYRSDSLLTLTGYQKEHVQNTLEWWEEKTHPDDRGASFDKFKKVVAEGGTECDGEYRFLCADGQYRHFYDKGHIVYRDGKPVRAIGIVHDITDSKLLEEKLLQEKVKRQKEISQAIITTQDQVCNDLSKELHDNVNQILATVSMMLHSVQNNKDACDGDCIRQSHEYVKLAMKEIRRISKALNTSVIEDVGLLSSVNEIMTNLQRNLAVKTTVQCPSDLEQQLSNEQRLMVFRIIQEQISNIIKHAHATSVHITIAATDTRLDLLIVDDGIGFDLAEERRGIGLANIRNRVEAFNGQLRVDTAPGKGCRLEISVPLKGCTPSGL